MDQTIRLPYQAPYDFAGLLGFFARRAISGIETVDALGYARVFEWHGKIGSLRVAALPNDDALQLYLRFADADVTPQIVARVRRMFDLDADIALINRRLSRSAVLKRCVLQHPGQRLPGGWDGFEIAVRAVLGQQVTVAAARTLTERLVGKFGRAVEVPQSGKVYLFPTPADLADADLDGLGITGARINCLREIAGALCRRRVDFRDDQTLDDFVAAWTALRGIGAWTAHYIAMRALGFADAFPAADIVLRKALGKEGAPASAKALEQMAQAWRPYRAYAVLHVWRSMS